jgi:ribulose-phosphate 3-epimerase
MAATNRGMTTPRLFASVMACDAARLHDGMAACARAGVNGFHWDIMDGHFVPNMTFGPHVVRDLRRSTALPFDVHLMVTDPHMWLDVFCDAGANSITIHAECTAAAQCIDTLRARHVGVGLALNPQTPLGHIGATLLEKIDRILIMTVQPGFGGQSMIDQTDKIRAAAVLKKQFPHLDIMVDGGINATTAPGILAAGATTLVSGSAIFTAPDMGVAVQSLRGGHLA